MSWFAVQRRAQQAIALNWIEAYKMYVSPKSARLAGCFAHRCGVSAEL